jgi:hypothetical protein
LTTVLGILLSHILAIFFWFGALSGEADVSRNKPRGG